MADTEQNKTEEATPFKLKRGREKGSVARSMDLGFFSTLIALTIFALVAAPRVLVALSEGARRSLRAIQDVSDTRGLAGVASLEFDAVSQALMLLGLTIVLVVALFEIIQLRGVVLSFQPLKPDFSRLNPGTGLKRVFSARMLKETIKNIVKLAAYSATAYFVILGQFESYHHAIGDAGALVTAISGAVFRLLFAFALLALGFAALDQVLVRGEFRKQMRMSRRELTREIKEREGEPRLKQKRKQLHAQFAKQTRGLGNLPGSDMLIVNPQHFAVALRYDAASMAAPTITSKGRNHFALHLRSEAARLSIAIFEHPKLARALYKSGEMGDAISPADYRAVADLYLKLPGRTKPHDVSA